MNNKVLLVDDESNLLHSLRRSLRGKYELKLAEGGQAALDILKSDSSLAVIVSDMQMPNVNGLMVLTEAKRVCPNTVRIMLTGNIDQQTAVDAVNLGGVFRFVNKPCEPEVLAKVIDEAIAHHEQLVAEKVLLSRTLTATVGLVTELLAIANPQAYGRSNRLKDLAKKLAERLALTDHWQLEIAAMLSQIGCIAPVSAQPGNAPVPYSAEWTDMLKSQAEASSQMVIRIPRLERVANLIRTQASDVHAAELNDVDRRFAKILRMLIEFDNLHQSASTSQVLVLMEKQQHRYNPDCLQALKLLLLGECIIQEVAVQQLLVGMVLEDHVLTGAGDILISKGHELTETIIHRLKSFQRTTGVREPILVRCSAHEIAA